MTKTDLIDKIYEMGYQRAEAADLVEEVVALMKTTLQRGESVKIQGFGNFKVRQKPARNGRNPQTGEDITIAARKIVIFKPSGVLREAINCEE